MNILKKMIAPSKKIESNYVGYVDSIAEGNINGWVYNKSESSPVTVELWIDGVRASSTIANKMRRDVAWAHNCSETCGFSLPIPADRIMSSSFCYEVIIKEGEQIISIPTAPNVVIKNEKIIKIPDHIYHPHELKREIASQLSHIPEALIALNHNQKVRLKNVDPHLANAIIINGAEASASEMFRTYPLADCLQELGYSTLIFSTEDIPFINHNRLKICIFVRVAANATVTEFVQKLRSNGTKIVADFDDLVFRPSLLNNIDGIRFLTDAEIEAYGNGMRLYREMIRIADQAWFTTKQLQDEALKLNKNSRIIKNFPHQAARDAANSIKKNTHSADFVIGYYSGTLTHQADFKVCHDALLDFLCNHKDAKFRIVGKFNLDEFPEIAKLPNIEQYPIMDYATMMSNMSECSIVLAPLVVGDEFCESKSELKFFDAALVYVPIIASPTQPFRNCITDYENGYLASCPDDWFRRLNDAYNRPAQRKEIGVKAHSTTQLHYSNAVRNAAYLSALEVLGFQSARSATGCLIIDPVTSAQSSSPSKRLAVLLPDIMIGSGGHRKALAFCNEYALRGGSVEVIFLSNRTDQELHSIVKDNYFAQCGTIRAYRNSPPIADVVVATSWQTCYIIEKWNCPDKYYFVQDFEPLFNAMNTDFALAYNTYRMGFNIIPFGRWNSKKLEAEFGIKTEAIDFPIDREIYFPDPLVTRSSNTLLFYARPSQPRRLFELGNAAILSLRALLPNWKFVYYGEDIAKPHHQGIEYIGKKIDLLELRRLYSASTIGVAFSTTNPSLIPFEMLSCGLPVVDVNISSSSPDFDGCESIVYSVPTVDDLAKTIFQHAIDHDKLGLMSKRAVQWASNRCTESEFAREVLGRMKLI